MLVKRDVSPETNGAKSFIESNFIFSGRKVNCSEDKIISSLLDLIKTF